MGFSHQLLLLPKAQLSWPLPSFQFLFLMVSYSWSRPSTMDFEPCQSTSWLILVWLCWFSSSPPWLGSASFPSSSTLANPSPGLRWLLHWKTSLLSLPRFFFKDIDIFHFLNLSSNIPWSKSTQQRPTLSRYALGFILVFGFLGLLAPNTKMI